MWTARRYAVPMRCCSHPQLSQPAVVVLAGGPCEAEVLAAQKLAQKYFTEQYKETKWVAEGEAAALDANLHELLSSHFPLSHYRI